VPSRRRRQALRAHRNRRPSTAGPQASGERELVRGCRRLRSVFATVFGKGRASAKELRVQAAKDDDIADNSSIDRGVAKRMKERAQQMRNEAAYLENEALLAE
jgi:hypothetical protein